MSTRTYGQSGYTLIEVLVGILIFALGMMALAQLQGNLSKASAESNARSIAINIAEEAIERARAFSQVTASTQVDAFNNIVSDNWTVARGGINYEVSRNVTDYYYNPATEDFQTDKPHPDYIDSDLKRVELTVSWGTGADAQSFRIDDQNAAAALGTGTVTLVDLISSFTTFTGGKVVLSGESNGLYAPPIDYNPGQNPDIISIQLGDNKFKESTTPLPDVVRQQELVETTFDVVTYSQDLSGATFLRREEFRAISCSCTLRVPSAATDGGLRPTVWDGADYTEGEFVSKPYGESANNQQSEFCDLCCRDHHDGGSGANDQSADPGRSLYDPFLDSTDYYDSSYGGLAGDHKHYQRDSRTGALTLATADGDLYVEACRLVRKDGFFRVTQDLRQEGLNAFPGDFLDDSGEVDYYSAYVTRAVHQFETEADASGTYPEIPPTLTRPEDMSPTVTFPASTIDTATQLPTPSGATEQQLRARGIYVDYLTKDLRTKVDCLALGFDGASCGVPDVTTALEIIPFFDVQLTWLARWNESPTNDPIDVTNEVILDNNLHSRGLAMLQAGTGNSRITSRVHRGNLGMTATDPIDLHYLSDERLYNLYALASDGSEPPPLSGLVVSGTISSGVGGVKAADVVIEAVGAQCDRTNLGYECAIEQGSNKYQLKVTNYFGGNRTVLACSDVLQTIGTAHVNLGDASNWTLFQLPYANITNANIAILENSCP